MQEAFRRKSLLTSDAFEALLDNIYGAGEDHQRWATVLAELALQLSAPAGALHAGARDEKSFSFGASYGVDPEALAAYSEYYHSVNPLNAPLSCLCAGAATPDHHLISPSELARTEFYNDYARPFDFGGSMYLVMARDDRREACLSIVRSLRSDPFTQEQASFVQRLAPHFRRAIDLNSRLAEMSDRRASLETALNRMETAVFVLDGAGVIRFSNTAAAKLLKKNDGLKVSMGRLCADDQGAHNSLSGLLQKALKATGARGGSVFAPRRYATHPLLLRVMPITQRTEYWLNSAQPGAILFISDINTGAADSVEEIMDAYGLTPSERKLLVELIVGRSLREAADLLKITRATSRNRLARIMAKTDTHRQGELIQLILRSRAPAR